ncbi:MAG: [FeFe] hydrogenase H-cluster maturation GTPase HydF [Oscillospiraceae bacterium]|nr:[FeFe] hydrogenase H-cluster maturation GTPase HydF [Oscillospiraceae bacterium]
MNSTPNSERVHIGIFGRRNAGKSSLLNAIAGQAAAVVSPVKGTTTDPVYKTMELLPIGPVVIIDTPGIDDEGELGSLRIAKTRAILRKTDVALLVADAGEDLTEHDRALIAAFEEAGVRYLTVCNKADLTDHPVPHGICVSALTGFGIHQLKEGIARACKNDGNSRRLVGDLLSPGDLVVLVIPIDESAPKGRLILPQQQVIRDILESQAIPILTQPEGLLDTLGKLTTPPKLVITDSQVFGQVAKLTPESVGLTSFSILMARYKGVLDGAAQAARLIDEVKDGDKILIAEGCTHHRQCEDIGTVKIPRWIEKQTGQKPVYTFTAGGEFPDDLSGFKLIIHCGGCMLNPREMKYRQTAAKRAGVPITNYGVAISHLEGILERCISAVDN